MDTPFKIIEGCTFTGNTAGEYGGGMCNHGSLDLKNCSFEANEAKYGGGMANTGGTGSMRKPEIINSMFHANTAHVGGGMYNSSNDPTIVGCLFSENDAYWLNELGQAAGSGGGVYNLGANVSMLNCVLLGNEAAELGGGVCNYNGTAATIANCTFASNQAEHGMALACDSTDRLQPSELLAANCILWDGGDEIWNEDSSTIEIAYSDVQGGWPGTGNIDADPFLDADFRLEAGSPCIDAGGNTYLPADSIDLDGDGDTSERIMYDADGEPRFRDNIDTPDTGQADPPGYPEVVDMGAYEAPGVIGYPPPPQMISTVISSKLEALRRIEDALAREEDTIRAIEEMLASGGYGGKRKGELVTAKQKIHAAIQHQIRSIDALERSLAKLGDALALLEGTSGP